MTLDQYEKNVVQWANDRNLIAGGKPKDQFTKTVEEIGEIASGIARNNPDAVQDGIGDVVVTLIILARQYGLTMSDCMGMAWNAIKDRKGCMVDGVFVKEGE